MPGTQRSHYHLQACLQSQGEHISQTAMHLQTCWLLNLMHPMLCGERTVQTWGKILVAMQQDSQQGCRLCHMRISCQHLILS